MGLLRLLADLPLRYGRPRPGSDYNPQIDGLRAVAIALVLVWHGGLRVVRQVDLLNRGGFDLPSPYAYLPHGEIGVALFFVISGFVIAQPFLSRPASEWKVGLFYWRRLHRLYPPYLCVLVICMFVLSVGVAADKNMYNLPLTGSFVASLFYMNSIVFAAPSRFNPPLWSLEVEIQFYLIVPFVMLAYTAVKRRGERLLIGSGIILAVVTAAGVLHGVVPFDGRFRFGLLAHVHLFFVGIVLADWSRRYRPLQAPARGGFDIAFLAGWIVLTGTALWMTQVDAKPPGIWPYVVANGAVVAGILLLFFGCMYGPAGRWTMSRPWVCLVGTMCYSIYLVHVLVIEALSQVLVRVAASPHPLVLWVFWPFSMTVAVAAVSLAFYVMVERPFMSARPFGGRAVRAGRA